MKITWTDQCLWIAFCDDKLLKWYTPLSTLLQRFVRLPCVEWYLNVVAIVHMHNVIFGVCGFGVALHLVSARYPLHTELQLNNIFIIKLYIPIRRHCVSYIMVFLRWSNCIFSVTHHLLGKHLPSNQFGKHVEQLIQKISQLNCVFITFKFVNSVVFWKYTYFSCSYLWQFGVSRRCVHRTALRRCGNTIIYNLTEYISLPCV